MAGKDDRREPSVGETAAAAITSAIGVDEWDAHERFFRDDYETVLKRPDGHYDDYAPSYRMGYDAARSDRYRGRAWDEAEADMRRDWETRYPGNDWERFKAAVRTGWSRAGNAIERALPGDADGDGR